jgi:hypothetical protein
MGPVRLFPVAALLAALALTGCAARRQPGEEPSAPTSAPPEPTPAVPEPEPAKPEPAKPEPEPAKPEPEPTPATPEPEPPKPEPMTASEAAEALEQKNENPSAPIAEPRLRDLCRKPQTDGAVDQTSRLLEETFCAATLWFDGLFGQPDLRAVQSARAVSGRVELSDLYTQFEGHDPKARLRVRYDLPIMERRINLFLERDDREDVVADRREGFALRSSIFGVDSEERWLAGLGYSPPGRFTSKLDFRVGPKIRSDPSAYAQARYRQNVFVGSSSVWRFRETVFYDTKDGVGETTSADFDHILRDDLLFRSGSVLTWAEDIDGAYWRQAFVLYHNLEHYRALAGEVFVRGETGADVRLQEWGGRVIYRFPIAKQTLFLDLVGGYSWPREEIYQVREGSAMAGVGLELLFGRDPF